MDDKLLAKWTAGKISQNNSSTRQSKIQVELVDDSKSQLENFHKTRQTKN